MIPLSILDLSPISAGSTAATALRNTIELAQHAERWGYRRFWVAEHHFVAVASASPVVLIGQIAAAPIESGWDRRPFNSAIPLGPRLSRASACLMLSIPDGSTWALADRRSDAA